MADDQRRSMWLKIISSGVALTAAPIWASMAATLPAICAVPFGDDLSPTTTTVGTGTSASCTESAFASALSKGGVIRFKCGGAAAIALTSEKMLRTDVNTTIDGQGLITLDGRGTTRLLHFNSPNWRVTKTMVTIENLTLRNGTSSGTGLSPAPAPCSQGTKTDGGGAAIYVRDGMLRVWNASFKGNQGATLGPDVAGGAIYAMGSLGIAIANSTFDSNRASNGGAIGSLWSNLSIDNSHFEFNEATGHGANTINSACHVGGGESGDGGNGGAVAIDGGEASAVNVCGSTFISNVGGAGGFGGAFSRTPDIAAQTTTIDRSTFSGNAASNGGALYFHNSNLVIKASTLAGNKSASNGGAVFADSSTLTFANDTFVDNIAERGLGGAIVLYGHGGTLENLTFLGNLASGGSGYFAAAIGGGTALNITNTIFDQNTSRDCGAPMACQTGLSSGAHNLQWPASHMVCANAEHPCSSGTTFSNPGLNALKSNGGPTETAAPAPGSPALAAGHNCPPTDQRGVVRPKESCTAGAIEGAIAP